MRHPELKNQKNGFYTRQLDTKYVRLEDLQVPRDRQNAFQTEVFFPYQKREQCLGEAIITMYQKGVSTREIGHLIEKILGHFYSASTITQITEVVYLVVGVTEEGYRDILGFYVGGQESGNGWKDVLLDLNGTTVSSKMAKNLTTSAEEYPKTVTQTY